MRTTTDRSAADPDQAARWQRVAHAVGCASARAPAEADAALLTLRLGEALLLAHDLFMLGRIAAPPTLRWTPADAEAALSPWRVRVAPEEDR